MSVVKDSSAQTRLTPRFLDLDLALLFLPLFDFSTPNRVNEPSLPRVKGFFTLFYLSFAFVSSKLCLRIQFVLHPHLTPPANPFLSNSLAHLLRAYNVSTNAATTQDPDKWLQRTWKDKGSVKREA